MGKLLGLPMGMAPCYTLHSNITLEGQQMATQLLTAAGANYFMDVGLNTDRMLAYFDTSGHDDQTLREVHDRRPAPEYLEWGLAARHLRAGRQGRRRARAALGRSAAVLRIGRRVSGVAGRHPCPVRLRPTPDRGPRTTSSRKVRMNQGVGREAIHAELRIDDLQRIAPFRVVATEAASKDAHLGSPDLGARLSAQSWQWLVAENRQVQIVVSDGLSAEAVHHNMNDLLPVLLDGFTGRGITTGQPIVARYGRVKLAEPLAERLQCEVVVYLIGERPGGDALASRSLSAYLVYRLGDAGVQKEAARFSGNPGIRFEYTVISNIYSGGLPPAEAGAVIVDRVGEILTHQAAGNRLESLLKKRAS